MKGKNLILVIMLLGFLLLLIKSDYFRVIQIRLMERNGVREEDLGERLV